MSHKSAPLISIIVAVFNGSKTLQQCIDSVAQQTYPNKELIIIDGGSKDGTVNILKANNEQIDYYVSEPDQGIYNAWNKALAKAKGEWICFLGADDFFWDLQALERMSEQLEKQSSAVRVVYGQIMLLNEDGKSLYVVGESWQKIKARFKQISTLPHPGAMHHRSLFEQHGRFDESFRIAGDYELLLRELKTADAVFIPDLITAGMRQGGMSTHPANSLLAMQELRRAQRMHGLFLPGWLWLAAMARVHLRLLLYCLFEEKSANKVLDLFRRMVGLPPYWTKI